MDTMGQQRELDLLWVALEEERLVVKMKNDVILSLQRALADAEERSRLSVSAAQHHGASMPSSYQPHSGGAHASSYLGSPIKIGGGAGGLGLSRSSSAPPSEDQEQEIEQRIAAAVEESAAQIHAQNFTSQAKLTESLEVAHRLDMERAFIQQLEWIRQLSASQGEVVATSVVVRTQLRELSDLRTSTQRAEDALVVEKRVNIGHESEKGFLRAALNEAQEVIGRILSSEASLLATLGTKLAVGINGAADRINNTSSALDSALHRETQLSTLCAKQIDSMSEELATDYALQSQKLIGQAEAQLFAKQCISGALGSLDEWISAANDSFCEYFTAKSDLSQDSFVPLIESTSTTVAENNTNVFKQIAAAKAKLNASTVSSSSAVAPTSPSAVTPTASRNLETSFTAVERTPIAATTQQQLQAPPPAWRQLETDYVQRIRQLEERHAQKARLLSHSAQRAEDLETKVASQGQIIEALQKASAAGPGAARGHFRSQPTSRPSSPEAAMDTAAHPHPIAEHQDFSSARDVATQSLKEQLRVQSEMLAKLEGAEREEINTMHVAYFNESCDDHHELIVKQLLQLRQTDLDNWHVELSDTVRNERKRIAEQKRFEQQNRQLMATFHIDPTYSDSFAVSALRNSSFLSGDPDVRDYLQQHQQQLGNDNEDPSIFADAVVEGSEINSATILLVQSMMLQQKREAAIAYAEAQSMLYDCFIATAPMSRAPETIRVQVAEGALALTEAQRDQAMSVAHWLTNECSNACSSLQGLLERSSKRDMATIVVPGGGHAANQSGRRHNATLESPLSPAKPGGSSFYGGGIGGASNAASSRDGSRAPSPLPAGASNSEGTMNNESFLMVGGNMSFAQVDTASSIGGRSAHGLGDDMFNAERVHALCDRLLEGVANMHDRLVHAEVDLGETRMELQQSAMDTVQYQEAMLNATVAQCVEREISDDALLSLRENLRIERSTAQNSIAALLDENQQRNVDIRDLQAMYTGMSTSAHAANFQASYIFEAFSVQLERNYEHFRSQSITQRLGMLPSPGETSFLLLMVHSKLGEAYSEAVVSSFDSFKDFNTRYTELIKERERHTQEVMRMAEELLLLQRERRLEKESSRFIEEHIKEGLFEEFLSAEQMNFEGFMHVSRELHASVSERAEAVTEAKRSVELREEMRGKLVDALELAEDRDTALSIANERALAAQRALEDRDTELASLAAAVKDKDTQLQQQVDDQAELTAEHKLFEQLLVAERQAHRIAQQREISLGNEKEAVKAAMGEVEAQMAAMMMTLDREKEAHRATIRSFAHHNMN